METCISQVTTLMNPFAEDPASYRGGNWEAVELWLTKLEAYLQENPGADVRSLFEAQGIRPVAASAQGGLLLSNGEPRLAFWRQYQGRLELLRDLGIPTLIVSADSRAQVGRSIVGDDYALAVERLGEAAELARSFGVRLALEFQNTSPICSCLETAAALVGQCGSSNVGVCLDSFHFQTGPSKLDDFDGLPAELFAWVQLSDVAGMPRELAVDADRVLPGDGEYPLAAIVERLASAGYDGFVALEVLNPHLWQIAADRVADLGHRALRRVLEPWLGSPAGREDRP